MGVIINGCKMFQIVKKLKLLKKELKMWNTQFFRNLIAEANNDRMTLHLAQNKLQADPMNIHFNGKRRRNFLSSKIHHIWQRCSYNREVRKIGVN